ncbi:MAG: cation diffusion facilitator family transporter [Candidatus Velamenicoccus archaeovorus]
MSRSPQYRVLIRSMLLSLATAIATMAVKGIAALVTGSVGLLSDAMESAVNLTAAIVALFALRLAERPADHNHDFGHGKAEYLSAGVEGGMVFVAAAAIVWTSVRRLITPTPLDRTGLGLALATAAALLNLVVGLVLIRTGKRHRSIVLVADGRHLLTDVYTTAGVLVGVALVAAFDVVRLDPIVALLVGVNILWTGYRLLRRSVVGLLDAALPPDEVARVHAVTERYRTSEHVEFEAVRTRESGRHRFVYLTVLVPEDWTVRQVHELSQRVEADIDAELPGATTFVQVAPHHEHPVEAGT